MKKSNQITQAGMDLLIKELEDLWKIERPETTKKVSWAASLGDRSENADYHYNKKRLREIDSRILYLRRCIDNFKVIPYNPNNEGKVAFGAWVTIENDKGFKRELRLVGYEELRNHKDYISMDSPMAKALLDKKVGDQAIVKTPVNSFIWNIKNIRYN